MRARILTLVIPVIMSLVPACGGASATSSRRAAALHPGSVDAAPAMSVLPDADTGGRGLSERMRFAWSLAEDALGLVMPVAPADATAAEMEQWNNAELQPWIGRKAHAIDAATEDLRAAAYDGPYEAIVGPAVIALMYEDMARALRTLPTPSDLESDAEVAEIYGEIVEHYARPYAGRAQIAYANCLTNARQGPAGMRYWADFCAGRLERLGSLAPITPSAPSAPSADGPS